MMKMESQFDKMFANPSSRFRGAPFWAWNCRLDSEMMTRQIEYFKEMGLGGFHMHCRTGLDTPYMSEEYLKIVKDCVEKAQEEGMYAWLYDEDRWPSGAAGGLVTKDPEYRARYLVFSPWRQEDMPEHHQTHGSSMSHLAQQGNGRLLARYEVVIRDGVLESYRLLEDSQEPSGIGDIWYAYEEIAPDSGWFNDQAYLDTLNPKAVQRFIEETHEKYWVLRRKRSVVFFPIRMILTKPTEPSTARDSGIRCRKFSGNCRRDRFLLPVTVSTIMWRSGLRMRLPVRWDIGVSSTGLC